MLVVDSRVAMAICTELLLAAAAAPPPDLVASWDERTLLFAGRVGLSRCLSVVILKGNFKFRGMDPGADE